MLSETYGRALRYFRSCCTGRSAEVYCRCACEARLYELSVFVCPALNCETPFKSVSTRDLRRGR